MKKLITTDLGGHPVYFKDFEFVQEQIRELAKSTFGHLDPTIVNILNGGSYQVSTDGFTIDVLTEGWAYYQGEFFYIPVHSATGSGTDVAKWNIVESYDARGLKTFKDATVGDKNVYLVRQLQVSFVPPASGGADFSLTKEANKETPWQTATVQSPFTGTFQYRLNKDGNLQLKGTVINDNSFDYSLVLFVLPVGFRPSYTLPFRMPIATSANSQIIDISIQATGEIKIGSGKQGCIVGDAYLNHTFYMD